MQRKLQKMPDKYIFWRKRIQNGEINSRDRTIIHKIIKHISAKQEWKNRIMHLWIQDDKGLVIPHKAV